MAEVAACDGRVLAVAASPVSHHGPDHPGCVTGGCVACLDFVAAAGLRGVVVVAGYAPVGGVFAPDRFDAVSPECAGIACRFMHVHRHGAGFRFHHAAAWPACAGARGKQC